MLINSNQLAVAKYLYEPYGNAISATGPLGDLNRYRFSSKEFDLGSGLYYFGLRFYDPNIQRWLSEDPIGEDGSINLYCFVRNSPLILIDFLGLTQKDVNKILSVYHDSVSNMTTEGERIDYGWLNNLWVWGNPAKRKGCAKQSDTVIADLNTSSLTGPFPDGLKWRPAFDDVWTFTQASQLLPPHKWVEAYSSNPSDPIIHFDPFYNQASLKWGSIASFSSSGSNVNSPPAFVNGTAP